MLRPTFGLLVSLPFWLLDLHSNFMSFNLLGVGERGSTLWTDLVVAPRLQPVYPQLPV
jgi:hypothetical protein